LGGWNPGIDLLRPILRSLRNGKGAVLALVAIFALPGVSQAIWFGLRNDAGVPVVVYAASDAQKPGKSFVLNPGEISMDGLVRPGNRFITICDRRNPKRIYFQRSVPCSRDAFYSMQPDGAGGIKLVPMKVPPRPR
jgi:hypothetical protein